jgi:beta-galactosidase/beta-glucuronidase
MTVETSNLAGSTHDTAKMDWENEQVFQRNRLPARSYFFPPSTFSLNGDWKFDYAATPAEAPAPSLKHEAWDKYQSIPVPSHWQLHGYGRPQYTNIQLPFAADPPYVPSENPTGSYFRTFKVPADWDDGDLLRLRFDGVDSAFHLFVNGQEVGYSQGSRNPAEFEIEDQDQWWLSGESLTAHNYLRLSLRSLRNLQRRESPGFFCQSSYRRFLYSHFTRQIISGRCPQRDVERTC